MTNLGYCIIIMNFVLDHTDQEWRRSLHIHVLHYYNIVKARVLFSCLILLLNSLYAISLKINSKFGCWFSNDCSILKQSNCSYRFIHKVHYWYTILILFVVHLGSIFFFLLLLHFFMHFNLSDQLNYSWCKPSVHFTK